MHATKRQAELGRDPHQGALIAASRFADHGAARIIGDVEPVLRNIDPNA